MNEEEFEKKIDAFREKIQTLKRKLIESNIYTTQDNDKVNEIKKRFSELYELLYPVLRNKKPVNEIHSVNLQEYMKDILSDIDIDEDFELLDMFHYYAYRDLIMFPLTLDTKRINSFTDTNSLKNVYFQ